MKKFTTILLLTVIILQTFSPFVIQAEYFVNKSYITKELCINKDKPTMHCNGKCYLKKKLKEQQSEEGQAPAGKKEKFELQAYYLPNQFSFADIPVSAKIEFYQTNDNIKSAFLATIFRPPTV